MGACELSGSFILFHYDEECSKRSCPAGSVATKQKSNEEQTLRLFRARS